MSHQVPGSELGIRISSSFQNGGRDKSLINDAIHYNTMREDIQMSNLGPGAYDAKDMWIPTSFQKYNKRPIRMPEKKYSHHSYDKPWQLSPGTNHSNTLLLKASKSAANADSKTDCSFNNDEIKFEINEVVNLPSY